MTYMGKPYYPVWLDNLADDVTMEAAAMDGTAHGTEDVRSIVVTAKGCMRTNSSNSPAPLATTASSRTTPPMFAASTSALSSRLPSTPMGRPSTSW